MNSKVTGFTLKGTGASKGFAIAPLHVLRRGLPKHERRRLRRNQLPREEKRFARAIDAAGAHLAHVREAIPAETPGDITAFIDTHLLMLRDSALTEGVLRVLHEQRCNVEWALEQQRDALLQAFDAMDDDYLRTRRDDVAHVVKLIAEALHTELHAGDGVGDKKVASAITGGTEPRVIVADDLTPADTVTLRDSQVAGFVTEFGGPNSHTAIVARSLRIPAIVGLGSAVARLNDGDQVVVDGREGLLIVEPDEHQLAHYVEAERTVERIRRKRRSLRSAEARTLDDVVVSLEANIDLPTDIDSVRYEGATGIGLYRTEYLFMNRPTLPDEEEQFRAYRNVLRRLKGAPVTIRTLDLGADKTAHADAGIAPTSALGLRAVRYCLGDKSLFRTQLRAVARASHYGPMRLLVPMITSLDELEQVRSLLDECIAELRAEKRAVADHIPLGVMVEVPAVAVCADQFARAADFLSVGTNDLIQYTLAVDRGDDAVNYLYDPLHPAVLRLIRGVIEAGQKSGTPVAMCGEMAGDVTLTRLLLGLGLREFSVPPSALLEVKQAINASDTSVCKREAARLLRATTTASRQRVQAALNEGLVVD